MNSVQEPHSLHKKGFSRVEKLFLFFAMSIGFLISFEYASIRPASSAIFLSIFSAQAIPWIWLVSVPINLLVVHLYNRYLPVIGPVRMIGAIGIIVAAIHVFCALFLPYAPYSIAVQFICKDIYILLMFKQLWSMIHSTIAPNRAKYLYGCIFGCGTIGAVAGSFIPGFFAVSIGSKNLFFLTVPLNLMIYLFYRQAFQRSSLKEMSFSSDLTLDPRPREAFLLIRRSPFLYTVLLLVVFMQVSVGLMDYQFNTYLEHNILDQDLRTEYVGRLIGATNLLSVILQFFGGFLMVRLLGLKGSHLFIPIVLLGNAALCCLLPTFSVVSISYLLIKSVDFSLFGVIREMLYIPMNLDEKFRAKAIIDVFAYRSAKAIVSICILGLQFFVGSEVLGISRILTIAVFLCWIAVVLFGLRKALPASSVQ